MTTYSRIVETVCTLYGVKPSTLNGRQRARVTARPRQIVMYLATTELGLSTTVVGRLLGGRDHSTVVHGRDRIAALVETDPFTRKHVDFIRMAAERCE